MVGRTLEVAPRSLPWARQKILYPNAHDEMALGKNEARRALEFGHSENDLGAG
jgi:hypothetical protein